ncbi:hypothetical protein [Dietzia kunjamensis]|uniref:hypothetical protein n=1 Tax=Dietzia kunjamensis TaxID=322509 RepID=UPI0020970D9F|nr:hypothetical protein [Dietzia kunjamensis]USX45199.1 hypothetical protein NHB83_13275 [Dietzia kunjamensis]
MTEPPEHEKQPLPLWRSWFSWTMPLVFIPIFIGMFEQSKVDGDLMLWRSTDLAGLAWALGILCASGVAYLLYTAWNPKR